MLMVTPAALLRLRSEPRSPVTVAPIKPAPVRRLRSERVEAIVDVVARMMRAVEPTPFAVEGPARAGIRSSLCAQGWRWPRADAAADAIVQSALARVGAKRPTWQQAQPEYTQEAVLPILREFCVRCGKRLPDGALRYCGPVCAKAADADRQKRRRIEDENVSSKVYRAAWAEKQPARECPSCGRAFQPKMRDAKYCSFACYHDARRSTGRSLRMVQASIRDEAIDSELLQSPMRDRRP